MSARDDLIAVMTAQDDQDWEMAKAWWRDATEQERLSLWFYMQQNFNDPKQEVMSRLAVLTYTRLFKEVDDPLSPVPDTAIEGGPEGGKA